MSALKIAFEPPERGMGRCASKGHPIDFAHLARQTMGDKDLEAEVLRLFAREARCALDRLSREPQSAHAGIAHKLKGAARGVGATDVAEAAGALEADPTDAAVLARLVQAVAEAENLICALLR